MAFAMRNFGDAPVPLTNERVPFGVNYSIRMAEQVRYLYDPCLGLRPGSTMRGDETSVIRRMLANGIEGWWVPGAKVKHFIPSERQTTRYIREWYVGHGQVLARDRGSAPEAMLLGRPRWLWRKVITAELAYRYHRIFSEPVRWVEALKEAGQFRGYWLATAPQKRHTKDLNPAVPGY
jgi:hypothetical protein